MEAIEQTFNGAANFGKKVQCTISRNGDLIHRVYLQCTLPKVTLQSSDGSGAQFRWLNWVGHNLINNVYIEIGGQQIDKHYGDWLHIWNELTQEPGKQSGYAEMVGNVPELVNLLVQGGEDCDADCSSGEPNASSEVRKCAPEYTLYIPLQFWFCRNPGLALPLIALQYHEVKIWLEFNELRNLCWDYSVGGNAHVIRERVASSGLVSASLYVDYIYLDTDERRRFAQVSHEYLIEQLQFTGAESVTSSSNKLKLNFNHPCKELAWVVQRDSFLSCADDIVNPWKGQQPFNYSDWWDRAVLESGYSVTRVEGLAGKNPVVLAKIQLNGHDRFSEREGKYFNLVQPYQHHTNIPAVGVNVYSFALKPEDHQPSGTCNFSRIDNATLNIILSNNTVGASMTAQVRVYAVNYNVLRIMSGIFLYAKQFVVLYLQYNLQMFCAQWFLTAGCLLNKGETVIPASRASGKMTWMRETPKSLNNYLPLETLVGIWGNDLRCSNIVKDWTIRRRDPKPVMIGHGSVSETAKASVSDEGLISLRMLKVQSGPYRNIGGPPGRFGIFELSSHYAYLYCTCIIYINNTVHFTVNQLIDDKPQSKYILVNPSKN